MNYWLVKSEPDVYSIDDLKQDKTGHWDGVRNYQARNFMRDAMTKGDQVFFYHSNCKEPGIYGIARVCKEAYPDHTAFDPEGKYYDPKSDPENPRWFMVDLRYVKKIKNPVSLQAMKENPRLKNFKLVQRGNRLSVMPVEEKYWNEILKMAGG